VTAKLSIAVLCFPSLGGSGVVGRELAVGLAERGHRVHVLASAEPGRPLPKHERLSFHAVPAASYPVLEHTPYTLALATRLLELGRREPLDIVHAHYAVPHASAAYLARQALLAQGAARVPQIVNTLHGTDVTVLGGDPSYGAITRFAVRASSAISVPSGYLAHKASAWLLEDAAVPHDLPRIEVIANFVDIDGFRPAEPRERARLHALFGDRPQSAEPVLFHVSSFRAIKRVGDLLEVLARVRAERPARLVIVGDGPERAQTEVRAREMGLATHVCFLGEQAAFGELLRHADAFVLPSEIESFGLAALEALSSGVPVLGYRVGGLPEVVTEDAGILVPPFDTDALANAALRILDDPQLHEALSRGARARAVMHFQREPAVTRYEELLARALRAPRSSTPPAGTLASTVKGTP
jgi:N-acetyl-alpha-D-glucosaminyl L-malate synthase BshA